MTSLIDTQIELLKMELDTVNESIRQMDDITKNVKQWTIALWTAATGGALAKPELRAFMWTTAAIPLLFWFIDTWHRRIQRKFIWRSVLISKFINNGDLEASIKNSFISNFVIWDPQNRTSKTDDYRKFVDWKQVMFFPSLSILYLGLIVMSICISILVARCT